MSQFILSKRFLDAKLRDPNAYIYKLIVTIKRCIKKLTSVSIGLGVGDELSVCANIVVIDNSNDIETNKILVIL